jgi:hypothetical protein
MMLNMNTRVLLAGSVLALCALGLSACNSYSTAVAPAPGPTCSPGVAAQLVYPAPGATAVPISTDQMVVAVSAALPNYTWNLALTADGSTAFTANTLATIAASQLPPGSASTTISNPSYESVQLIAPLPSGVQIAVALNDPNNSCTPETIPGATFSTQ